MHTPSLPLLAALVLAAPAAARPGVEPPPDKSRYTLLNPTPRHLRREMETDRPDATESPRTIDAGAVQLEMSLAEFTRDSEDGARTDSWAVAPINLKIGLLNNADLQFLFTPYAHINPSPGETARGVGDFGLRLKINLWGNDDPERWGGTALGIMPFIIVPTADDDLEDAGAAPDGIEGGIILPFSIDLPHGLGLGLMAELDFIRQDDGGYTTEFVHSVVLGRDLVGALGGYVEYIGVAPLDPDADADYSATFSTGLTYALSPDAQLDAGLRVGLTERDTDDLALFAGLSLRF